MSSISDDDLNLSADNRDRLGEKNYAGQAYVGPVRGKDGVKAIFAPANRKRLLAYAAAGILLGGGVLWVWFSLDEQEALKGGMGAVKSAQMRTSANQHPTQSQVDEANRYNDEALPKEQEANPTAHPVIVTAPEGEANPFEKKAELSRPSRISETGTTTTAPSNTQTGRSEQRTNTNELDGFIKQLIQAEGERVPESNAVEWKYQTASAEASTGEAESVPVSASGAAGGSEEQGSSKCENPAARAGSMHMATADLALNSDVGGPVSLTFRSGRLRGSQLLGKFERKETWLRMELDKLVTNEGTYPANAIGLDMETTLNAVQGDVDRHVMYRYGWWGFGTVLKAVGKAAELNADTDVYVSDGTVVETTESSSSREVKLALGSLGEDMGEAFQDRLNRPITVSLKVNDEVGVFFMDDVCLPANNSF